MSSYRIRPDRTHHIIIMSITEDHQSPVTLPAPLTSDLVAVLHSRRGEDLSHHVPGGGGVSRGGTQRRSFSSDCLCKYRDKIQRRALNLCNNLYIYTVYLSTYCICIFITRRMRYRVLRAPVQFSTAGYFYSFFLLFILSRPADSTKYIILVKISSCTERLPVLKTYTVYVSTYCICSYILYIYILRVNPFPGASQGGGDHHPGRRHSGEGAHTHRGLLW